MRSKALLAAALSLPLLGCDLITGPGYERDGFWMRHDALYLEVGQSVQLLGYLLAEGQLGTETSEGSWTSESPDVVEVSANGLATAKAPGAARVTVRLGKYVDSGIIMVDDGALPRTRWADVAVGGRTTCALDSEGTLCCWGGDYWGEVPDGARRTYTLAHSPMCLAPQQRFDAVGMGTHFGCGRDTSGSPFCWGWANIVNRGGSVEDHWLSPRAFPSPDFTQLSAGHAHACGIDRSAAAHCWGMEAMGELGQGRFINGAATPLQVHTELKFNLMRAGHHKTCGLAKGGAAYCWGNGSGGALGNGGDASSATPVRVQTDSQFTDLAGVAHTCGLTSAGRLQCWGPNFLRGIGDFEDVVSLPVMLDHGRTYAAVSAGLVNTCALTPEGAAYCWGSNEFGQLGAAPTSAPERCTPRQLPCSPAPIQVPGELRFRQISVGKYSVCAITTADALYCWGSNEQGQLGSGRPIEFSAEPVPVRDPIR